MLLFDHFGIAPYCKSLVMDRIKSLKHGYVLLFDESLNLKTQTANGHLFKIFGQ